MNQDPLAQLQDIVTPEQITWWPLAWGWWVLIILAIAAIAAIIFLIVKRYQLMKAKKAALNALSTINVDEPINAVKQINNILKRAVLAYAERSDVAELNGDKWANWLNQNGKTAISKELLGLAYQPNCEAAQAKQYQQHATAWIKASLPKLKSASQSKQKANKGGANRV